MYNGAKLEDTIMILSRGALFSRQSSLPLEDKGDFSSKKRCRGAILAGYGGDVFLSLSKNTSKKIYGYVRAGRLFLR